MNVSEKAEQRLLKLLPENSGGFFVEGFVGTCRGSTPVISPASEAKDGQKTIRCGHLVFFVNPDIAGDFSECSLDYDPSFFGKGLTATWPHRAGCACHS